TLVDGFPRSASATANRLVPILSATSAAVRLRRRRAVRRSAPSFFKDRSTAYGGAPRSAFLPFMFAHQVMRALNDGFNYHNSARGQINRPHVPLSAFSWSHYAGGLIG